jgi:hypothetical protein
VYGLRLEELPDRRNHADALHAGRRRCPTAPATPAPTKIIALTGNLAFGNVTVGSTATQSFTIQNSGTATLTITALSALGGTGATAFTSSWSSGVIPSGGTQAVSVQFTPPAAQYYDHVLTAIGDQTSGNNGINVSGTGIRVPPPPPPPAPGPPPTTTPAIAGYMAGLHAQALTTFAANEQALVNQAAAAGTLLTSGTVVGIGNLYVASVQGFVNASLTFVRLTSQTMAIDRSAVSTLAFKLRSPRCHLREHHFRYFLPP